MIGLFGIVLVYSYTGKPLRLKYKGLGLLITFIVFGPLAVLGSFYVQALTLSREALLISNPIGLLTTAILQANDLRDMQHDKLAGIKTLSIIIGKERGKLVYCGLIILPYVFLVAMIFLNMLPTWSLLVFSTLHRAKRNIKVLNYTGANTADIIELDKKTAQLQAQFGILLIASVLL
jgi:1,4-dihydroxy-2-naphthoate octaprenyltransferase